MKRKRLLFILCIIFFLAAAGSFFILFIDQWHIEINIDNGNDIKVEYGDTYEDGTVTATLKGRYLLKKGYPLKVTSEGTVDTSFSSVVTFAVKSPSTLSDAVNPSSS